MGWKSTVNIKRSEAIQLIISEMMLLQNKTNKELEEMLIEYGFGDTLGLAYYGRNFIIEDD